MLLTRKTSVRRPFHKSYGVYGTRDLHEKRFLIVVLTISRVSNESSSKMNIFIINRDAKRKNNTYTEGTKYRNLKVIKLFRFKSINS